MTQQQFQEWADRVLTVHRDQLNGFDSVLADLINRVGALEARGQTDRAAWQAVGRLVLKVTPSKPRRKSR